MGVASGIRYRSSLNNNPKRVIYKVLKVYLSCVVD